MSETTLARPEAVKAIVIMGGVPAVEGYIKDTHFGLDPEAGWLVLNSSARRRGCRNRRGNRYR